MNEPITIDEFTKGLVTGLVIMWLFMIGLICLYSQNKYLKKEIRNNDE